MNAKMKRSGQAQPRLWHINNLQESSNAAAATAGSYQPTSAVDVAAPHPASSAAQSCVVASTSFPSSRIITGTSSLYAVSNALDEELNTMTLPLQDPIWRRVNRSNTIVTAAAVSVRCPATTNTINPDGIMEPTPIQPKGILQVVDNVPLDATSWSGGAGSSDNNVVDLITWMFRPMKVEPDQSGNDRLADDGTAFDTEDDDDDEEEEEASLNPGSSSSSTSSSNVDDKGTTTKPKREKWEERFQELLQYRKQFGHCLVPHNWSGNSSLAQWVKRQRYQYNLWCKNQHSTLTLERIQVLNHVGFVWNSHVALWDEKFNELEAFKKQHGHCNVPSHGYFVNRKLSIWVRSQRRQYKLMMLHEQQQQQHQHQEQQHNGGGDEDKRIRSPSSSSSSSQPSMKQRSTTSSTRMTRERFEKLQSLRFIFDPRRFQSSSEQKTKNQSK